MNFDFGNWFLGIITALVVAVAGRLIYKAVSDKIEKKAHLDWFVLANFSAPDLSIHKDSFDLFYAAKRQDEQKFSEAKIDSYQTDLRNAKKAVKIKIRNNGRAPSDAVALILERAPNRIELKPTVGTKTTNTADSRIQLEIAAVDSESSVELFLYGISEHDISGLFHKGIAAKGHLRADLVPKTQPPDHRIWALNGFFLGIRIFLGLDYLANKSTESATPSSEKGALSEDEGKPAQ